MEGEYEKIREEALTTPEEVAEPKKAAEPEKAGEPEKAAEPHKNSNTSIKSTTHQTGHVLVHRQILNSFSLFFKLVQGIV